MLAMDFKFCHCLKAKEQQRAFYSKFEPQEVAGQRPGPKSWVILITYYKNKKETTK